MIIMLNNWALSQTEPGYMPATPTMGVLYVLKQNTAGEWGNIQNVEWRKISQVPTIYQTCNLGNDAPGCWGNGADEFISWSNCDKISRSITVKVELILLEGFFMSTISWIPIHIIYAWTNRTNYYYWCTVFYQVLYICPSGLSSQSITDIRFGKNQGIEIVSAIKCTETG